MSISLLVATPQLTGTFFEHAALLMLEQEEGGALGLMINRPTGITIREALPQAVTTHASTPVYQGGPVETSGGWCLYRQATNYNNEIQLAPQLWLTRDSTVLQSLLEGKQGFMLLLGYAGWGKAQLENEVRRGSWLWGDISESEFAALLWQTADGERWQKALDLLGVGAAQLGGSAKA